MKLAIFGDSHVSIYHHPNLFGKEFETVSIHQCDADDYHRTGKFTPYLMNTIAKKGDIILKNYMERYQDYDFMMFVFGEPDVRIHFHKQIHHLHRAEEEVIHTLCVEFIAMLQTIVPKNTKIIIRYILPPRESSMFGIDNNIYVPQGSLEERVRYTNKMNETFKQECNTSTLFFFDNVCQSELIHSNGELSNEYCDGVTHYSEKALPILQQEIATNFNRILYTTSTSA